MKILIGTPIHESKDYSLRRWLENVKKLTEKTPADLLIVDNSPDTDYLNRVKAYCKKYGIINYKIKHLTLPRKQEKFERIARSREVIRHEILTGNYDAWFCWECDQIIPNDTLDKLVSIMQQGNYMLVNPNKWQREIPDTPNYDFGCALISKEPLKKYSFILDFGTEPEMPNTYELSEYWFKQRIIRDGGRFVEVDGVINPIFHLNK
jgi:hypothetical protein